MKSASILVLWLGAFLCFAAAPAFASAEGDLASVYQDTQNFDGSVDLDGLSVNTKPASSGYEVPDVPEPEGVPVEE